jgi:uncharacterized protein
VTVRTIVDTGPLVAFFNAGDAHHEWACEQFTRLPAPMLTCEAVLAETCFLVARGRMDPSQVLQAVARGALQVDFTLGRELEAVRRLMARYQSAGISLADACLVRMSETYPSCQVLTTDRDFQIYRRHGRRSIPIVAPFH